MVPRLRANLLQMQSVDSIESNLDQIESLISGLSKAPEIRLICLPENALYFRLKEGEPIPEISLAHSCFEKMRAWSAQLNSVFHIGSLALKIDGRLTNSSVMVWPNGKVQATYQKIHLFDIELSGRPRIRESDVFGPGHRPQMFDLEGWKWGQSICYDLRFSELYSQYAKEQVMALLVPSAFLRPTGEAHWHILLRARAIENQAFVLAAAQAGVHKSSSGQRETYGHSLVIDPWGKILAEGAADRIERIDVELDHADLDKVRQQIPMAFHRRLI